MRGKTEAAGGECAFDLYLRQSRDQRAALQSFLQSPGGFFRIPRLDDEKKRWIKAEGAQARPVRAPPFPDCVLGEAPQHEIAARDALKRPLGDHRKGETERRRFIAIGFGSDLMQPTALQSAEKLNGVILRGLALCASHLRMTF